jgi:hypothetical protein
MFNLVMQMLLFLRARWRWAHGRCSLCNRHLYAASPYFVADHPGCSLCKQATERELRMGLWGGLADFPAEEGLLSDPECPSVGTDQEEVVRDGVSVLLRDHEPDSGAVPRERKVVFVAGCREQEVERCRSGSPTSGVSGGA